MREEEVKKESARKEVNGSWAKCNKTGFWQPSPERKTAKKKKRYLQTEDIESEKEFKLQTKRESAGRSQEVRKKPKGQRDVLALRRIEGELTETGECKNQIVRNLRIRRHLHDEQKKK